MEVEEDGLSPVDVTMCPNTTLEVYPDACTDYDKCCNVPLNGDGFPNNCGTNTFNTPCPIL